MTPAPTPNPSSRWCLSLYQNAGTPPAMLCDGLYVCVYIYDHVSDESPPPPNTWVESNHGLIGSVLRHVHPPSYYRLPDVEVSDTQVYDETVYIKA